MELMLDESSLIQQSSTTPAVDSVYIWMQPSLPETKRLLPDGDMIIS